MCSQLPAPGCPILRSFFAKGGSRTSIAKLPSLIHSFDQQHLLVVVYFAKLYFDDFAAAGWHMLTDIRGLDGQLAMAAVNQHSQLHTARAAVVEQRVKSGPDCPAGIKHVVADHHVAAFNLDADGSRSDHGTNVGGGKVVAIKLDVEHAGGDGMLLDAGDQRAQTLGSGDGATTH